MLKSIFKSPIITILRWAANVRIKQVNPKIVGVTGSVGKSSFVYMLDTVTKSNLKTKTTFKGNSETGLPLEILGLRDQLNENNIFDWLKILFLAPFKAFIGQNFEVLIAEMGVDGPKEPYNMSYLLKIVKPQIGVLLSIAPVHTQQFSEILDPQDKEDKDKLLKLITTEKGKLVTTIPSDGIAIINIDSSYIKDLIPDIKAKIVTFGEDKESDFKLTKSIISTSGSEFEITHQSKKYSIHFKDYLLLKEYGLITTAVLASADSLGLNLKDSAEELTQNFHLPPGRSSLIPGKKDSKIIDSSYNSSPVATNAMLEMLGSLKVKGKKIAVLGDMRELGPLTAKEHQNLASNIQGNCDFVALIGPAMYEHTLPKLLELKFPKDKIVAFANSQGVEKYLEDKVLTKEDLILVKGSQNTIFLEEIVKDLMKDPNKANELLCRQSKYWDKTRAKFFKNNPNTQHN